MARIDDYANAKQLAVEALKGESADNLSRVSGFTLNDGFLEVPFLGRRYRIAFPSFDFIDGTVPDNPVPVQEQVLILHYIMGAAKVSGPVGNWISYREIPGAAFYFSAFVKRATDPLKKRFGQEPESLAAAADRLGAAPIDMGDVGFEIRPFPKTPLQYILWVGDDEFPSEANILFDETIGDILSAEDAAWLAGMGVYRMVALAQQQG